MNMDLKTCKSLDSILLAFGENDHLDRDSVLKLFNDNENEAAKHINILAQFNHIKKIAEVEDSKLGLAFLKEDNTDLLLAQGGFTELYLKAAEEKKTSDERQNLADENARLANEAHKHQATIHLREDRIKKTVGNLSSKNSLMKIFISHSSKNKNYGEKLVDLLRNIGVKENEIIFTSNTAYGIPVGQNIFNWLKSQISEKPFVIYLLSEEYYQSIACLNEMGAAWIIENKHAAIFTPNFDLSSKEFQSGALDPREIGFFINDEDRIFSFIHLLSEDFKISTSHIIVTQSVKRFLEAINTLRPNKSSSEASQKQTVSIQASEIKGPQPTEIKPASQIGLYAKFLGLITAKKLREDELILLYYIIETGRFKLMTGWQEHVEILNIKEWEKINDIKDIVSSNYTSVLKRFELRGYIEVSAVTSSNNPKEFKIKDEIAEHLLGLPDDAMRIINETVEKNYFEHVEQPDRENDSLDF